MTLCAIGGANIISGGNSLATGAIDHASRDAILSNLLQRGFLSVPEPGVQEVCEDTSVSRQTYIAAFGPTVGDRVRLGDTELWIEVERDEVIWSCYCEVHLIPSHDVGDIWRRGQVWWRQVPPTEHCKFI